MLRSVIVAITAPAGRPAALWQRLTFAEAGSVRSVCLRHHRARSPAMFPDFAGTSGSRRHHRRCAAAINVSRQPPHESPTAIAAACPCRTADAEAAAMLGLASPSATRCRSRIQKCRRISEWNTVDEGAADAVSTVAGKWETRAASSQCLLARRERSGEKQSTADQQRAHHHWPGGCT